MTELGIKEIQKILPHRCPMLLLDKVTTLQPGQSAEAIHNVSFSEPFVQASGAEPVFPRPLIIETMAQTGAVALLSEKQFAGKTAYFGGIPKAEFLGDAKPGDQMVIKTKLTKIRKNFGVGAGAVYVKKVKIASAELTFMIG